MFSVKEHHLLFFFIQENVDFVYLVLNHFTALSFFYRKNGGIEQNGKRT